MKIPLFLISFLFLSQFTFAQFNSSKVENFTVYGNCGMCKTIIEKAALSQDGVSAAVWDVESKKIKVVYDKKKTNSDDIKRRIAEAGYDSKEFRATDEKYKSLHGCCQYDRPKK